VRRFLLRGLREEGQALVLVIGITAVMTVLAGALLTNVQNEATRSRQAVTRDSSYQAAEAGIDDYVAKLLSDSGYYGHVVHPFESTRRSSGGVVVAAGGSWVYGLTWTYPNGKDKWSAAKLGNGYEYNIEVTAPTAGNGSVSIVSTGRPVNDTATRDWRVIQAQIRPSAVSDFQMMANADISYGSTATTYGKIYALKDSSGVKHNVSHSGNAYGDIYAEGRVSGSVTMHSPAGKYDSVSTPGIRTVIKNPVNFAAFLSSIVDVQHAAQNGGVYLNDATKAAWRLIFNTDGTVSVQSCQQTSSNDVAKVAATCGSTTTYNVPANGAIYTGQTAIVSGTVNGRVTVASNNNIVIADNLYYTDKHDGCTASGSPGPVDDILGLDAQNDVVVAQYAPSTLLWCAATIAQNGQWHSYSSDGSHTSATFIGSTATNQGGQMSMFASRTYKYDDVLFYMQPPWFPLVGGAYTVFFLRELPSASQ
jgi:hypothetical protein